MAKFTVRGMVVAFAAVLASPYPTHSSLLLGEAVMSHKIACQPAHRVGLELHIPHVVGTMS